MKKKIWVIKAGSRMVCEGGPLLIRTWMKQIKELKKSSGIDVIWVTSGAIASASNEIASFNKKKKSLPEKQALSAIGQPLIMDQYNLALAANGMRGSQVLLTSGDIKDPNRKKNLQNTLKQLLKWSVVPILNENDAVATEEIQFGDNDALAAQVAVMIRAEKLILLTDVEGLYEEDPKINKDASIIRYLNEVKSTHFKMAPQKNKSAQGTGGMFSKLNAAHFALRFGVETQLVKGDIPSNLIQISKGIVVGTQIGGRRK